MDQNRWNAFGRKITICIDSYEDGVPEGCFYTPNRDSERFTSLMQFLLKMEEYLDDQQTPQSYTSARRFTSLLEPDTGRGCGPSFRKGSKATFQLQVLFRQHSSWQGILTWREGSAEQGFRSVLELVVLLDSALRSLEGSGVA